ncbi:hypothetical protein QP315_08075, partial [Actinotignum timonense]|uniref:hypothetical protein n=1 Tax=Actinotignum timonense TaxID=1870995 RepID=UPI00254C84DD
ADGDTYITPYGHANSYAVGNTIRYTRADGDTYITPYGHANSYAVGNTIRYTRTVRAPFGRAPCHTHGRSADGTPGKLGSFHRGRSAYCWRITRGR